MEGLSKPHGRRAFFSNVVTFAHHLVILGLVPRTHTPGLKGRGPAADTGIMDPRHKAEDDGLRGAIATSHHNAAGPSLTNSTTYRIIFPIIHPPSETRVFLPRLVASEGS